MSKHSIAKCSGLKSECFLQFILEILERQIWIESQISDIFFCLITVEMLWLGCWSLLHILSLGYYRLWLLLLTVKGPVILVLHLIRVDHYDIAQA